jgi:hypothetical protein
LIEGKDLAEVTLMSNMNSDIKTLQPYTEALQDWMEQLMNEVLDQQVVKTDMKLRHIYNKALQVRNNHYVLHHSTNLEKKHIYLELSIHIVDQPNTKPFFFSKDWQCLDGQARLRCSLCSHSEEQPGRVGKTYHA